MTTARHTVVPEGISRCYHCFSRCVRQMYLCGNHAAHRKEWIKQRLLELTEIFAMDVGAFAIMGNHLHLIVRTQPEHAESWSPEEVVVRWLALFPRSAPAITTTSTDLAGQTAMAQLVADSDRVDIWRKRLASLSWFMKCLKEPIARRANREDNVTGHFWSGRFRCQPLLDDAAVLACMAYIDLNPVRAAIATTPEGSVHASVHDRVCVRQSHRTQRPLPRAPRESRSISRLPDGAVPSHDEDGIWLVPVEHGCDDDRAGLAACTLDEYLLVLDVSGRNLRPGKRGHIPPNAKPILERLDIDIDRWLEVMHDRGRRMGTAIGSAASLASEAARRGRRWIIGALGVHKSDH